MYVWQDVRKACPLDQSPSYLLGNAGGGGRPIGADWMGVTSTGRVFREVEGGCRFCSRSSSCWKPVKSVVSCAFVSISLALESIIACSTATRQTSGVGAC